MQLQRDILGQPVCVRCKALNCKAVRAMQCDIQDTDAPYQSATLLFVRKSHLLQKNISARVMQVSCAVNLSS